MDELPDSPTVDMNELCDQLFNAEEPKLRPVSGSALWPVSDRATSATAGLLEPALRPMIRHKRLGDPESEPTALAAGLAAPVSVDDAPDASAYGSRSQTVPRPKPKLAARQRSSAAEPETSARATAQKKRTGSKLRWLALTALTLFGGLLLSWGLSPTDPPECTVSTISATASSIQPKYETREIRDIRTGHRVMADNPELADDDVPLEEITPATHRNLVFRQHKPDGGLVEFELVRSLDWIAWTGAEAGRTVELDLSEFGVDGPAEVLDIQLCPTLEEGPGRLVTGTFRHTAHNVIDVTIAGLDEPIGVTANHPFWSEDRQAFIAAAELCPGESVLQADGEAGHVIRVTSTPRTETVHNIEVEGEHAYFVSDIGVLVHNTCTEYVYRALNADDVARLAAGKSLVAKGMTGRIIDQVQGRATKYISASEDVSGIQKYLSPEYGYVKIRVSQATRLTPHKNVLQAAKRHGRRQDVENVLEAKEVLFSNMIGIDDIVDWVRPGA